MTAVLPVIPDGIPAIIKSSKRWFPWRAGQVKPTGKFDKIPVDPVTGKNVNPLDPANWYSFDSACQAYCNGIGHGLGIALSDAHPIVVGGEPYYLTAIDLDNCVARMVEYEALWRDLGEPYVEASPSGKGLRMLGLSRTLVRSGNAGAGREVYANKHFVTITGSGARGQLCDFTSAVVALERQWFGSGAPKPPTTGLLGQPAQPEHPAWVGPVLSMLDAVSSDTDYDTWRAIIFSLASTEWACARQVAHHWSKRAAPRRRYDAAALDKLFDRFDPSRGVTLGTLKYHAKKHGWTDDPKPQPLTLAPPPRLHSAPLLMTAAQLRQLPATPYVVRGVFPAEGLAAIYGEPGSGKSFLALHLAHAVATGAADWFGFSVKQQPVVYVALEGMGGIGKRITALEMHSDVPCPDRLRFWCRDIHLLAGTNINLLASEIESAVGTGAIVIIDTLNQAAPGAEENSSQDMGKIIAGAKRLAAAVAGLVILVHHAGKTAGKGLRGHSSLLAAMDTVIWVSKKPTGHKSWSVTKSKDDSSDIARDFELVSHVVSHDDCGPVTSCAVQHTVHAPAAAQRQPTGKHQKVALAELRSQLPNSGQTLAHKSALAAVAAVLDAPQAKRAERAKEAVDALIRNGNVCLSEGGVCLA